MSGPMIGPVASLAHYCTCWTACNRLVAATSRTARSCGREQPPSHSHMGAWRRNAGQQHSRFKCDERMDAPIIGPVASLAPYCT